MTYTIATDYGAQAPRVVSTDFIIKLLIQKEIFGNKASRGPNL